MSGDLGVLNWTSLRGLSDSQRKELVYMVTCCIKGLQSVTLEVPSVLMYWI